MSWIQTRSGNIFDYSDPKPSSVRIQDIAHALSLLNRFSGHTKVPYSVAQHSVFVSRHVNPRYALAGLLHDCHEAFVIDLPKPLKVMVPDYRAIEDRIQGFVLEQLGMPLADVHSDEVKLADRRALGTEARDLLAKPKKPWSDPPEPFECKIIPWTWESAEKIFMQVYFDLTRGKPSKQCRTCLGVPAPQAGGWE